MLSVAVLLCAISVVTGVLGFSNLASGARTIAKVSFFIALTILVIIVIFGLMHGMLVFG